MSYNDSWVEREEIPLSNKHNWFQLQIVVCVLKVCSVIGLCGRGFLAVELDEHPIRILL